MAESPEVTKTFCDLYPTLSEEELKEAEANFRRYLQIASQIHEEKFDTSRIPHGMRERSNFSLKD